MTDTITWCRQCNAENPNPEHLEDHGWHEYRMIAYAYGHQAAACRYCGINHGLPKYVLSLIGRLALSRREAMQALDNGI